jgi:hypothetical protein
MSMGNRGYIEGIPKALRPTGHRCIGIWRLKVMKILGEVILEREEAKSEGHAAIGSYPTVQLKDGHDDGATLTLCSPVEDTDLTYNTER